MEKIANLFIDDGEAKHKLIGHIVGESKIFYHWLLPLSKKPEGKFSLKELQIVKDQNYQHFKERKVERLQNIKHPHFKNEEALESVLLYTS